MFQSTKQKRIAYVIFGVYFLLLIWLVLFKFATNLSQLPCTRSVNWIPFFDYQKTSAYKKEVIYNILAFIPLGVYLHILKDRWKYAAKCLVILGISFFFEVVQFLFALGISDVTDLIGNTLGGMIGMFLCVLTRKIASEKYISIINALGLLIEIIAVGLLLLLMAANH